MTPTQRKARKREEDCRHGRECPECGGREDIADNGGTLREGTLSWCHGAADCGYQWDANMYGAGSPHAGEEP